MLTLLMVSGFTDVIPVSNVINLVFYSHANRISFCVIEPTIMAR